MSHLDCGGLRWDLPCQSAWEYDLRNEAGAQQGIPVVSMHHQVDVILPDMLFARMLPVS